MPVDRDDDALLAVRRRDDEVRSRTASSRFVRSYWRWMNNISATRIGMRTRTSQAPSTNLTEVTMTATIAGQDRAERVDRQPPRQPGARSRSQWRIMPDWLIVKSMNTPTA